MKYTIRTPVLWNIAAQMGSSRLESQSHHVCHKALCLIFLLCQFRDEGQDKKQTDSVCSIFNFELAWVYEMQKVPKTGSV